MSAIRFKAKMFKIGSWNLLRLPESASAKLPSRGMTMVEEPSMVSAFKPRSNQTVREATGSGSTKPCAKPLEQRQATLYAGDRARLEIGRTQGTSGFEERSHG